MTTANYYQQAELALAAYGNLTVGTPDVHFADLRLWRNLNQDDTSQTDELFILGNQRIAALRVGKTEHTQTLPNGNQLGDPGSYIRTDGSSGTLGAVITTLQRSNKAKLTLLVVANKRAAAAANDTIYSGVFARASA